MNEDKVVEVHTYVSELVDNEDGRFDIFDSAYLIVRLDWVKEQAESQGFESLKDFFNTYTYDDTRGWIDKAARDGVLVGTGTGLLK